MNKYAVYALRVGMGAMFILLGADIIQQPKVWAFGFVQDWLVNILGDAIVPIFIGVGILDIVIGLALLIGIRTYIVSIIASLHLFGIIIFSDFNTIIIRDIGLLSGMMALAYLSREEELSDEDESSTIR